MKERVVYRVDSFVDFTGIERQFVMAALSQETDAALEDWTEGVRDWDIYCPKRLSLGISVCRPEDTFNEETGKAIALGKARRNVDHAFYSTDPGLINRGVVEALLDQEAAFFKQCPGKYITGYDEAKEKYEEEHKMVEAELSLSDEERAALETLLTIPNERVDLVFDLYNYKH